MAGTTTPQDLAAKLESVLEPLAADHGLELVAVEVAGGRRTPLIRVLLDCVGGIDLEALTGANRWISETLDAEESMRGPYTLEVSSPGVDRPLRKMSDFERFLGETAHVKTRAAKGRSAWTGTIVAAKHGEVTLDVDGEEVRIPFEEITKARLKGVVDFGKGGTK